ncbi:expressed unknown protein [Ectocarpus siliculosus]|uniref:Uncharacterized protein n=1 Tax=Ectocarpus siliculosus TaxID=2880 RepID=D8LKJ4_ECTSI|nr:expressed unknown protein [Ectocarpus siliculosus]|eukprot:CBN74584.1 expressed unknown protein [Ectocarpus siliculosus]
MSAAVSSGAASGIGEQEKERQDAAATLDEIDGCLRRWKAARHEGQAVLTDLSNALLLRTYVDKGGGGGGGGRAATDGAVWGALAGAGTTVSRVSVATEHRARRLHGDLSALQDAMVAAAGELRRHAREVRRRWVSARAGGEDHRTSGSSSGAKARVEAADAVAVAVQDGDGAGCGSGAGGGGGGAAVGGGYALVDVADTTSQVAEMLMKEALVTATVVQGVGQEHGRDDREALTVYAAAWMMQPYVDAGRLKELEVMVGGQGRGKRG